MSQFIRKFMFALCFLMLGSTVSVFAVMASGSGVGENILHNSGFEQLDDHVPMNWESSNGWTRKWWWMSSKK